MKELKPEAAKFLSIIHHQDVIKVVEQIKVVAINSNESNHLQDLTDSEYEQLINLLIKYEKMLDKIPTT